MASNHIRVKRFAPTERSPEDEDYIVVGPFAAVGTGFAEVTGKTIRRGRAFKCYASALECAKRKAKKGGLDLVYVRDDS